MWVSIEKTPHPSWIGVRSLLYGLKNRQNKKNYVQHDVSVTTANQADVLKHLLSVNDFWIVWRGVLASVGQRRHPHSSASSGIAEHPRDHP